MTDNPFDAGRDHALGQALRSALDPGEEAGFAARFRAVLAEESPWARFSAWTWPGLVAAAATLALAVGMWSTRGDADAVSLEQAFAPADAQQIVAAADRPGSDAVFAAAFGGDQ
jgi:hypothetical protein